MDCLAAIITTGINDLKSLRLTCSLQTRNTKFLIAPRLNQVSMSCTRVADKSAETYNNKPFENKFQSVGSIS